MLIGEILTQYIIPILSIVVSVAFGVYGYTSSKKAEQTLSIISKMMESWQNKIMDSMIELIQATPSAREGRIFQTKIEAIQNLAETIKSVSEEILKNPKTGDEDIPRQAHLARLMEHQEKLIKNIEQNRNI